MTGLGSEDGVENRRENVKRGFLIMSLPLRGSSTTREATWLVVFGSSCCWLLPWEAWKEPLRPKLSLLWSWVGARARAPSSVASPTFSPLPYPSAHWKAALNDQVAWDYWLALEEAFSCSLVPSSCKPAVEVLQPTAAACPALLAQTSRFYVQEKGLRSVAKEATEQPSVEISKGRRRRESRERHMRNGRRIRRAFPKRASGSSSSSKQAYDCTSIPQYVVA